MIGGYCHAEYRKLTHYQHCLLEVRILITTTRGTSQGPTHHCLQSLWYVRFSTNLLNVQLKFWLCCLRYSCLTSVLLKCWYITLMIVNNIRGTNQCLTNVNIISFSSYFPLYLQSVRELFFHVCAVYCFINF